MYLPNLNLRIYQQPKDNNCLFLLVSIKTIIPILLFTKILFYFLFFLLLLFIVSIPACFSKKLSFTCIFGSVASDLSGAAKFLYTSSTLKTDLIFWQPQHLDHRLFLSIVKILHLKNPGLKSRMLYWLFSRFYLV